MNLIIKPIITTAATPAPMIMYNVVFDSSSFFVTVVVGGAVVEAGVESVINGVNGTAGGDVTGPGEKTTAGAMGAGGGMTGAGVGGTVTVTVTGGVTGAAGGITGSAGGGVTGTGGGVTGAGGGVTGAAVGGAGGAPHLNLTLSTHAPEVPVTPVTTCPVGQVNVAPPIALPLTNLLLQEKSALST